MIWLRYLALYDKFVDRNNAERIYVNLLINVYRIIFINIRCRYIFFIYFVWCLVLYRPLLLAYLIIVFAFEWIWLIGYNRRDISVKYFAFRFDASWRFCASSLWWCVQSFLTIALRICKLNCLFIFYLKWSCAR